MTVFDLKKGEEAEIVSVNSRGAELERLLSLGIERGARVRVLGYSLFKSAELLGVGFSRVAMRRSLAERIEVKK